MRMETVRSDITKFEHSAALSLNDILGTVQDLSDDIRRECGHAIEDCQPEEPVRTDQQIDLALQFVRQDC